jgi:hypothetical protein
VTNRPVNFNDPTGHSMNVDDGVGKCDAKCIEELNIRNKVNEKKNNGGRDNKDTDTNGNGIPDVPDPNGVIPPAQSLNCQMSLIECLYSGSLLPDGDITISDQEWSDFTRALFYDVKRRASEGDGFWTHHFNPENQEWPFVPFHTKEYNHRAEYDTPFWDGYGQAKGNVCFTSGKCYSRNDVNYIAQGMWSAAAHEGKWGGEFIANYWKQQQYGHDASPEVLYWIDVGVDTYAKYDWRP